MDKSAEKFYAEKLRAEHPELKDAPDAQVLSAVRKVELPEATDQQWVETLQKVHGAAPEDKGGFPTGALITGAVGLGIGALAAAAHVNAKVTEKLPEFMRDIPGRVKTEIPPEIRAILEKSKTGEAPAAPPLPRPAVPMAEPASAPAAPMAEPPPVEPVVTSPAAPPVEPLVAPPTEPSGALFEARTGSEGASIPPPGVNPTSRANQLFDEPNAAILRKMEKDPDFLKRVQALDGGRRVTHEETWRTAFNLPTMSVDELSNWDARKPVSELDEARAAIVRTYYWGKYQEHLQSGNFEAAAALEETISRIEPGYNNLTGTPGRALNFQKAFQFRKDVTDKLMELRDRNVPYFEMRRQINQLLKATRKTSSVPDQPGMVMKTINAIEDFATAMKLTSAVTHLNNSISNTFTFVTRAAEKTLAAAGSEITGDHANASAQLKYALGTSLGWKSAARKFLTELTTDRPEDWGRAHDRPITPAQLAKQTATPNRVPKSLRPLSPFRWLAAADNFWKTIIYDSELYTKAYEMAANEHHTGLRLAQRVEELRQSPLDSWKTEARATALEYTFQEDPDRLLRGIQHLQNIPLVRLVIPFVQTPYNIVKFHGRRSVFGVASRRFWREVKAGGPQRMEALSRMAVGLGLTGGAITLATNGEVTSGYPTNPKERALWIQEHRQPWSIKVGKYWLSYNRVQPLGSYLMTVSAIKSAYEENKFDKAENKLGRALSGILHGPLDLPFLQGMSALFDIVQDPERNIEKFKQLVVVGFFPNVLRDVRIQMDPTQRVPSNVTEAIETMFPGLSENVPARVSVLGEEIKAPENRVIRSLRMTTQINEDERTQLMNDIGWTPPTPETKLSFMGEEEDLTGNAKHDYLEDMGKAANQAMKDVVAYPKFWRLDERQKKRILSIATERYQGRVRKIYIALHGLAGDAMKQKAAQMLEEIKNGKADRSATSSTDFFGGAGE